MARLFTTGFETGAAEWNGGQSGTGTTVAFTTVQRRSGAYSLNLGASSIAALIRQIFDANQTTLYGRLAIRLDTVASGRTFTMISFRDSNNAIQFRLRYDAGTGTLQWQNSAGTVLGQGFVLIPVETWMVLEFETIIGSSGSLTLKVNGTTSSVYSGNTDLTGNGVLRSLYFQLDGGTGSANLWLDDIAINNTDGSYENSWVGLGGTFWLRPEADGDQNDWTPSAGTDNWDMVDEVPPNTTDYVQALDPDELDLYEVQDCPAYIARIRLVQVLYRAALATSGENYLRDVIRVDVTNYEGPTFTIVPIIPSFTLYKGETHYINPDTEAAWQVAEVDDLQAGFEIDEAPS